MVVQVSFRPVHFLSRRIFSRSRCAQCVRHSSKSSEESRNGPTAYRLFSGIQPTGIPHLGNYIGAVQNWVKLQGTYDDVIFSVVDLHSITMPFKPLELRQQILDMTACLLACGIDPKKSILFQQSSVWQHAELAWVLGCLCMLPRLQHLPQWRDKSERMKTPGLGLLTYPVLQAADILLYKATVVPVGEDQVAHIELARDLAKSFNRSFGFTFPKPSPSVGEVRKIKSLRNPVNKMSKSDEDPLSRIGLTDTPDEIVEKIRKAKTDFTSEVTYNPEDRPGVSNLIDIHCALTGRLPEEVVDEALLLDTGAYKQRLAEVVVETLAPLREEIGRLQREPQFLVSVLEAGRQQAAAIAERTMEEVRARVGLSLGPENRSLAEGRGTQ